MRCQAKMQIYWVMTVVLVCSAYEASEVTVSDSTCEETTYLDSNGYTTLKYTGFSLFKSPCKYEFTTSDWSKKICVEAITFDLPCNVKVLYNGGSYTDYFPDETWTCTKKQTETWCKSYTSVHISFESDGVSGNGGTTELRIYTKDEFSADIIQHAVTSIAVIIGVVVAVIVTIIVIIIVVVCCVCNRRRSQAGTVYRTPQQAAVTTVVQPTTTPAAYPYQPQPQAGYQPPPPPQGYQQHPAQGYGTGYQPSQPQGYQAGYQPPPGYQPPTTTTEKPTQASAPAGSEYPMTTMDQPPPYPGN